MGLVIIMYSNNLVCDIIEYLNNNINKEITIDELSNIFFFNRTYLMKRFKKELGISIFDYINSMRILNSLPSFKDDNYFLSIAFKNGFNSLEYFSEMFKKVIGVSPITYKKYISYSTKVSKLEQEKILENVSRINNTKNNALRYLGHRKPTGNPSKKITL